MITEFSPVQNGSVLYYADPALSGGEPSLLHGFATRRGGVSTEEHLKEMNLGFFRGEARALTEENYARFASAVGIPAEHLVFANQTHTHRIAQVGAAHHGVGVTKPPVYFAGKDANDHENEVDARSAAWRWAFAWRIASRFYISTPAPMSSGRRMPVGAARFLTLRR